MFYSWCIKVSVHEYFCYCVKSLKGFFIKGFVDLIYSFEFKWDIKCRKLPISFHSSLEILVYTSHVSQKVFVLRLGIYFRWFEREGKKQDLGAGSRFESDPFQMWEHGPEHGASRARQPRSVLFIACFSVYLALPQVSSSYEFSPFRLTGLR